MSRTYKERIQVFAVVRFDADATDPEMQVTVKELVHELDSAVAEVERLNRLNAQKGCRYFWQATRLFPPGTAAGELTPPHVAT